MAGLTVKTFKECSTNEGQNIFTTFLGSDVMDESNGRAGKHEMDRKTVFLYRYIGQKIKYKFCTGHKKYCCEKWKQIIS